MTTTEKINELLNIKESFKAPDRIMEILYSGKKEREKIFMKFLKEFDNDIFYDWFHEYFQEEQADRKLKKQDFTPDSIGKLLAALTQSKNKTVYEPTAGTGGILIKKWVDILINEGIFKYSPNDHLFVCEELSDRSIPFLLFNLCIRGLNAVVMHGDVLTRECYGVFLIQNIDNDYLNFSNFNVFPYTKEVEKYFNIKFIEQKYQEHIENVWQTEN